MHVIDDSSPLRSESEESLRRSGVTFILSLSGTDETTGHTLMARQEYPDSADPVEQGVPRRVLDADRSGYGALWIHTLFHEVEDLP